MSTVIQSMTAEEFLALPEDGTDRELIRGELREKPMTLRNRFHSKSCATVTTALGQWAASGNVTPAPDIVSNEAGFILRRNPDTTVGIDVAVVAAQTMSQQGEETSLVEGIPILAVEVLSPSDTQQDIHEKIDLYLEAGTSVVWIVDPDDRTVRVYRPHQPPVLFNERQTLSGEPELPGFEVAVKDLFGPR